jgi:hypothetical protein
MTNADQAGASPEFEELEPLPELPGQASGMPPPGSPPVATAGAPRPAGGPREIEKAPLMLQKAALVLILASLLPWLVPEGWNLVRLGAKVVILLGGWFTYCGVEEAHGRKTPLGAIGAKVLPILGLVIMVAGLGVTLLGRWEGMLEGAALAVGVLAWCAVHGYSLGGKFNPSWALIIPFFGIAALFNVFVAMSIEDTVAKLFAILGSLGVVAAGGFAGYTMFVSMKEARAHGEAKKRAASEARMNERRQKRKDGPPPPPVAG